MATKQADTTTKTVMTVAAAALVLLRPLVSEKGTYQQQQSKYLFEVAPDSNKIQIKRAVESLYDVEVTKVAVLRMMGKTVRVGRKVGRRKHWKKAIVTLQKGQRITTIEGV